MLLAFFFITAAISATCDGQISLRTKLDTPATDIEINGYFLSVSSLPFAIM